MMLIKIQLSTIAMSSSNNEILKQLGFAYCTDREFNNLICDVNGRIALSLFHINFRSLKKNHRGLSLYAVN